MLIFTVAKTSYLLQWQFIAFDSDFYSLLSTIHCFHPKIRPTCCYENSLLCSIIDILLQKGNLNALKMMMMITTDTIFTVFYCWNTRFSLTSWQLLKWSRNSLPSRELYYHIRVHKAPNYNISWASWIQYASLHHTAAKSIQRATSPLCLIARTGFWVQTKIVHSYHLHHACNTSAHLLSLITVYIAADERSNTMD
jgi:hypothetical protein